MFGSSKTEFLIREHKSKIYSYALYMVRSQMDAEDIAQEVLVKIWKNVDNFKFTSAKAWIMRTTHNLCIDYLRKNKKIFKSEFAVDEVQYDLLEDKNDDSNPYRTTNTNITGEIIRNEIEKLPERLKSPFILYEIEGFSYKEISKILDVPLNTIKVNMLRARKQLQKQLSIYRDDEIGKNKRESFK